MADAQPLLQIDAEQLKAWRREFHQYPEMGWGEYRTTARLAELLNPIADKLLPGREFLHRGFIFMIATLMSLWPKRGRRRLGHASVGCSG